MIAPVQRDRTYGLALIAPGAPVAPLSRMAFHGDSVQSQTVYRVAPGGRWLAFRDDDALVLLNAAGRRWEIAPAFDDFRFSADGRWLAVATRTSAPADWQHDRYLRIGEIVVVDLGGEAPQPRPRLRLWGMQRIEWSAAGVLVHQ